MKKNRLFLILFLFSLILLTNVNAIEIGTDAGLIRYYNFTDTCTDNTGTEACILVSAPPTISSTPDDADGVGYKLDGGADCIITSLDDENLLVQREFTICYWVNQSTTTGTIMGWGISPLIYDIRGDGTNLEYYLRDQTSACKGPGGSCPFDVTTDGQDLAWHHLCLRLFPNDQIVLSLDGVTVSNVTSQTSAGAWSNEDGNALGCLPYSPRTGFHAAEYDEWAIYNVTLNDSQIIELYNGTNVGTYCNPIQNPTGCATPPPPPPPETNNSVEGLTDIDQISPVIIGSTTFSPVITGTFNVTAKVPLYATFTSNLQFTNPTFPASAECRLNFDGDTENSGINRTHPGASGAWASIKGSTTEFNYATSGPKNATLECAGSTAISFTVDNSNIIIHHLADASGNNISFKNESLSETFNFAGDTFLQNFTFNTTNITVVTGSVRIIIAEIDYNIEYIQTGNVSFQPMLRNDSANQTCAHITRFGSVSDIGSAASYCAWIGAPTSTQVVLDIFSSGNATVTGNIWLKEFILGENETAYISLIEQTFTSTSYTNIVTLNLSSSFVGELAGYSAISSETHISADRIDFRIKTNDVNGSEMFRTVTSPDQLGVVMLQDAFNNLTGDQNITIQGRSSSTEIHMHVMDFFSYFALSRPFTARVFNITLTNRFNNSALINFNVTVNGATVSDAGTGTVTISTGEATVDVLIQKQGFINETVSNHDTSGNLAAIISQPGIYEVDYSDFFTVAGINYTRNLSFTLNYTCLPTSTIILKVGNVDNRTLTTVCDGIFNQVTSQYRHGQEEEFNTSFEFNSTFFPELNDRNTTINFWFADLINPDIVNITFEFARDFVAPATNFTFTCVDNVQEVLNYTLIFNGNTLIKRNQTNQTVQFNETTSGIENGFNNATYICADMFGNTTNTTQKNIELRTLFMIDEQRNIPFDVSNLTSVIVFLDDNRTSFDFTDAGVNNVSFIAAEDVKLRFQLLYPDGTFIIRYVDTGLLTDDVRVCANTDEIIHFEQLIISTTSQPVIMQSIFADCVVAADFTRFAFEDALSLKAYTFNNLYSLIVFDDNGNQIILASVDGSSSQFINIDVIEVSQIDSDIIVPGDTLAVQAISNASVQIRYINSKSNNDEFDVTITRLDSDTVLFTADETGFADPNNWTIIFDWSTITPQINESVLMSVVIVGERTDGSAFSISQFFNGAGSVGQILAELAAVISLFLIIFGVPLGSTRTAFSWLGILFMISSLIILTMAISAWYTIFLQAISLILIIIIFIFMMAKNQATIA